MKYYVSAAERWRFWETAILEKGDIKISLEYNVKWGTVEVEVPDDFKFDEDFNSEDFDDWSITDTGDEEFEQFEMLQGDVFDAPDLDFNEEEYFDLRESLEDNGWEYVETKVYIDNIIVEESENENV
jgi:hypothetical protein|tara:strand:- start:200 stop:580 length:381 start_codon:yes stop_codon:yes gene_type:complete